LGGGSARQRQQEGGNDGCFQGGPLQGDEKASLHAGAAPGKPGRVLCHHLTELMVLAK
jgi:hypothetical protein